MQTQISRDDAQAVEMLPGLIRRTLAWGENAMICEFTAEEGVIIPMHSHHHEQVGYVLEGRVQFTIREETFITNSGDSCALPGHTPHAAHFLAPTILIEVFSPVREEYQ